MLIFNSPAATLGVPSILMPDIIDSLKRLERIGSENSKTVEKIISAAQDIERKISGLYPHSEVVIIDAAEVLDGRCELPEDETPDMDDVIAYRRKRAKKLGLEYHRVESMRYEIQPRIGRLKNRAGVEVSRSREAALEFAKDLANGLFKIIELDLKQRQAEDLAALASLEQETIPDLPLE